MTTTMERKTKSVLGTFTQEKSSGDTLRATGSQGNLPTTGQKNMGIDADAHAHIMSMMTDLYSNPTLAVIREYSSNALDSHQAAGNPDPIEVTLPSAFSPTLVIADKGLGLSADELYNVYAQYGKSTKRDDMKQVGAFGLGCKSALTYTQQFTVSAVKDGEKNVAVIGYGEGDVPTLNIITSTQTTEPNGVTVSIPSTESARMRREADEFFATWQRGTVLVDGEEPASQWGGSHSLTTDEFSVAPRRGAVTVIMGNVAYKVDLRAIDYTPFVQRAEIAGQMAHNLRPFGGSITTTIRVPIGSVDLTPNRESMRYSSRTKAFLTQAIVNVLNEADTMLAEKISTAPNKAEALSWISAWSPMLGSKIYPWQGQDIPESIDMSYMRVEFQKPRGRSKDDQPRRISASVAGKFYLFSEYAHRRYSTAERYYTVAPADTTIANFANRVRHYLLASDADLANSVVYVLSAEPSEWAKAGMCAEEIPASTLMEKSKEYRRAMAAANKADRGTKMKAPVTSITYPVLEWDGNKDESERVTYRSDVTVQELSSMTNVHYDEGENSALTREQLLPLVADDKGKATLIVVSNSRKPAALVKRVPHAIAFMPRVTSVLQAQYDAMTDSQKALLAFVSIRVTGYGSLIENRRVLSAFITLKDRLTNAAAKALAADAAVVADFLPLFDEQRRYAIRTQPENVSETNKIRAALDSVFLLMAFNSPNHFSQRYATENATEAESAHVARYIDANFSL